MRKTDVPATAVVGVVAGEDVHVRVDAGVEDVALPPVVNLHFGAVRAHADDTAAAPAQRAAVRTDCVVKTEVADGYVDPSVDAHANAVGGVVGAAFADVVGADTTDEPFLPIGHTVAVGILVQCEVGRV